MSKPLFFTGRRSISRADVTVRIIERPGELTRFDTRLDLAKYEVPPDALVVLEAYHNAYLERFPLGMVTEMGTNHAGQLERLEPGDRPHFRVKVVTSEATGAGRLLAAIDEVRPATEDDAGSGNSLLPLVPKSKQVMGDEFWRVEFQDTGGENEPELWINRDVQGLFAALQNQDPRVAGLIMPEVLRQVLRGLIEDGSEWTDEGKLGQWLMLASEFHPDKVPEWEEDDVPGSIEQRRKWADAVVARFAASHRFFDRFHEQTQAAHDEVNDD